MAEYVHPLPVMPKPIQPVLLPSNSVAITLHPLKSVGNLRERYSESTADVIFTGEERLPAHRAVLSVASSVFFKMFDGDWRESREKNIPAPTEYSWKRSRQQSLFSME